MPHVEDSIRELATTNRVVLFMKGSRHAPQCGFSAQAVEILNGLVPSYETVNVLADPKMRDGINSTNWPTIPQLYIDGKFVGGCDIVKEMSATGELAATLGVALASPARGSSGANGVTLSEVAVPALRVTARAASAIAAARESAADDLRMVISVAFEHELFFDGALPGDVVVQTNGVTLRLDPESALRANGVAIDFIDTSGGGFKVDNPNEPARVRPMSPKALRASLDAKEPLSLFDVRTPAEWAKARIDEAIALDDAGQQRLAGLPKTAKIVFMCHHGMRSRVAAEAALRQGFTHVWNLEGGIDAWSTEVARLFPGIKLRLNGV